MNEPCAHGKGEQVLLGGVEMLGGVGNGHQRYSRCQIRLAARAWVMCDQGRGRLSSLDAPTERRRSPTSGRRQAVPRAVGAGCPPSADRRHGHGHPAGRAHRFLPGQAGRMAATM